MIQTLATNASDHAFHVAILPRTSRCNQNFLDVHSFNPRPEQFAIDSIAVSNYKSRSTVFRKCFDDLLCSPNRSWMLRDIEVNDAATIVGQDDEDIKDTQANRCDREEIDGYQLSDMIAEKRRPGLSGLSVMRHQSRNGPFGNLKAEFQQFAMDSWRSPDRIRGSHGSNQLANVQIHSRASWPFRM